MKRMLELWLPDAIDQDAGEDSNASDTSSLSHGSLCGLLDIHSLIDSGRRSRSSLLCASWEII